MLNLAGFDDEQEFEASLAFRITCILLLLWWAAYFYPYVSIESPDQAAGDAGAATANGSSYNQLVILAFAALGFLYFPRATTFFRTRRGHLLAALAALYCLWGAASIGWSLDAPLSVRRLIAFILILLGSFGLGAGFYARTRGGVMLLAKHVLITTCIGVVLLLFSRGATTTLADLSDPRWSLKDTARLTVWIHPLGYTAVACLFLFRGQSARKLLSFGLCFLMLVLLKGRAMIGEVAAVSMLVYSRTVENRLARAIWLALGGLFTLVMADLLTGGHIFILAFYKFYDSVAGSLQVLTQGEGAKNITTLSGRLPLWQALYPYIQDRPFQGYGFGAFWNAGRFDEIYAAAGWRAVIAHNGFIDELLATGGAGLALFLCFWLCGMVFAARKGPAGYLVCGWLFLFLLFNGMDSIFQTFFQFPTFASLTALFTVMNIEEDETVSDLPEMILSDEFTVQEMA